MSSRISATDEAPSSRFQQVIDVDRDGFVSAEEAHNFALSRFGRLDADNDGQIGRQEFLGTLLEAEQRVLDAAVKQRLREALQRREAISRDLDRNGDGSISREEFLLDSQTRFHQADTDRDGRLTPEELRPARTPF